ncbi:MAG: undecaprenyldiphospho-muramoylpentapeptide beta-N-acetylglucosaminyltransferase [Myxococcota bacterium]
MIDRVIVAGGGTGGHLFPGIAVVEELRRRNPRLELLFVGTEKGIEARVIPELGERFETLMVRPLKGRAPKELLRNVGLLPQAAKQSMDILRAFRPDLVIGVGGYASGPLLAAAAARGVPTAILEQNAHVGMTNRVLARVVGRAYISFEETKERFPRRSVRSCGNPIRRSFVRVAQEAAADPEGFEARASGVLVLGGSQGARAINAAVPRALARVVAELGEMEIVHQTGANELAAVEGQYRELGLSARVVPFIDDMARKLSRAQLVIGRAGATSVAELSAIGRPSILVPYPYAADDHQTKNAQALERGGAAICLPQDELEAERLFKEAEAILGDRERRRAMAQASRNHGKPEAAAAVVDDLCEWLGCPEPPRASPEREDAPKASAPSGLRGTAPYIPRVRGHRRQSVLPPSQRSLLAQA